MPIPNFQTMLLPFLVFAGDKQEHSFRECLEYLSNYFNLTEDERKELLPSGKQTIFANRVGWSRTYLKKAGLLQYCRRGFFRITNRGLDLLKTNPDKITTSLLKQYPEYLDFVGITNNSSQQTDNTKDVTTDNEQTPEETLEYSYQEIRNNLADEILDKVKSCSPNFFEKLVVELLVKMGYGGSMKEAGRAIGKTGDEGIDGIIKEDRLGLDAIYIQAKRWDNVVGRPELQKFVGALAGQGAKKGIFITTSRFSEQAKSYSPKNDIKLVLIDGQELAEYIIEFDLGVSTISEYKIKKIDFDYFESD
ncbi:restriction endonuclease [Cyanobacterium aponinum FACHB-4101]|uniref:restriction endonuclease n=1 Tax=Cyanobacterium aponinum TaxID=379064 RepID=UPI0016819468|nr:restriction endonuclease [Cyanobacterium aponinum]MBD2395152.1 restriction endonuclease [Cyanobacterium aponinum FACHB-4101]